MTKLMSSSSSVPRHLSLSLLLLLSSFLMITNRGDGIFFVRAASSSSLRGEITESRKSLSTSKQQQRRNNSKLTSFPLIPGDSPEARRRRRRRRKRRQLASTSSSSAEGEEQQQESSPLELQRDQLYEGYGVHYVDLWIGCPIPQRVTVIVDTGSSVTGFPCEGCHHCGGSTSNDDSSNNSHHVQYHTDTVFHQNESTCFQTLTTPNECLVGTFDDQQRLCAASKHYSEGSSWEAFEATDLVYTGGDHTAVDTLRQEKQSFSLHFGCQDKVTGLFETQLADGIMGLYNSPSSFWYQAYASHAIEKQMFSLCFSEPGHVERTGTPAGTMVLGGSDTRLHLTSMVYANQISKNGKYKLHLEKVYLLSKHDKEHNDNQGEDIFHKVQIFEEDLNNGNPGVILDSGTTATYLTKQLARHFVQVFNSLVSEDIMVLGSQKEYQLTRQQFEQLPTIVFQMRGAVATRGEGEDEKLGNGDETTTTTQALPGVVGKDLDPRHAGKSILVGMPPSHYFIRTEDTDQEIKSDPNILDEVGHYKLNIFFSKSKNRGGVLGANFMRGHDVEFDMENGRVGFALSDCEYSIVADDEEAG